jgi:hypothetical protein
LAAPPSRAFPRRRKRPQLPRLVCLVRYRDQPF